MIDRRCCAARRGSQRCRCQVSSTKNIRLHIYAHYLLQLLTPMPRVVTGVLVNLGVQNNANNDD